MFTVNLEKKLLKDNSNYLTSNEQKFVDFVSNTLKEKTEEDDNILRNAGFSNLLLDINSASAKNEIYFKTREKYKEKLFNEEQIKSICLKYNLRFLSTDKYKGYIPPELPNKIKEFKKEFSLNDTPLKYFICAPKSSFKLETKPVDPLFFCEVKEGLYVLIYKWGNDLNFINRIIGFIKSYIYPIIAIVSFLASIITFYLFKKIPANDEYAINYLLFVVLSFFVTILMTLRFCIWKTFLNDEYVDKWNQNFY